MLSLYQYQGVLKGELTLSKKLIAAPIATHSLRNFFTKVLHDMIHLLSSFGALIEQA